MAEPSAATDAIKYASELGRLDLVTAVLAALGLILALGGIFAFFDVRRAARATATETATAIAGAVAESAAVAYLERELPRLADQYRELANNAARDEDANAIAEAQENSGG